MSTTSTGFVILDRSKLRRPWELLVERHTTGRSGAEISIFRNEVQDEHVLCRSSCKNSNIRSNRTWKSSLEFAGNFTWNHETEIFKHWHPGRCQERYQCVGQNCHVQFCGWKAWTISDCSSRKSQYTTLPQNLCMDVYWSLIFFQFPIYLELKLPVSQYIR